MWKFLMLNIFKLFQIFPRATVGVLLSACKHVQTIARIEGCRREYYDFHAIDECLPLWFQPFDNADFSRKRFLMR